MLELVIHTFTPRHVQSSCSQFRQGVESASSLQQAPASPSSSSPFLSRSVHAVLALHLKQAQRSRMRATSTQIFHQLKSSSNSDGIKGRPESGLIHSQPSSNRKGGGLWVSDSSVKEAVGVVRRLQRLSCDQSERGKAPVQKCSI